VPSISLSVNGRTHTLDIDPEMPLLWALRDLLGLVGTKFGCGGGFCGACTVHVDGVATRSCTVPTGKVQGRTITTIEGLPHAASGGGSPSTSLGTGGESGVGSHPVQRAWVELDVAQCGYCQAGQIMAAAALLARTPAPTDEEIAAGMNGNLCRCGTYMRIREAVRRAASIATSSAAGDAR
jgi:isoquinoline 1-oxidoreductase subunit alpha